MVVNAALYPPACPTRIKKSRLVIPIEQTPRLKEIQWMKYKSAIAAVLRDETGSPRAGRPKISLKLRNSAKNGVVASGCKSDCGEFL